MKFTVNQLRSLEPCSTYNFEEAFPKGAPLTPTGLRIARKAGLDIVWLRYRMRGLRDAEKRRRRNGCRGPCNFCDDELRAEVKLRRRAFFKPLCKLLGVKL
jgi:hypothetical protein